MEWTKNQRAEYFAKKLSEQEYPSWGRAQRLSEELGVSHSQASNWLTGAVPREHSEISRVADHLGIDIMEWVFGRASSSLNMKKLVDAIAFVKTLEVEDENTMSPQLFAEIAIEAYEDKIQGAAVLDSLAVVADIRSRGEKERNGQTK